jgi:PadR family transcriptional regulator, regulatory protein PadR
VPPDHVRLSPQTLLVLDYLLDGFPDWSYGYDMSQHIGLKSGTLYPILMRLKERGWLETRWEHPEGDARPRHMYRFTRDGRSAAREALAARKSVKAIKSRFAYERS